MSPHFEAVLQGPPLSRLTFSPHPSRLWRAESGRAPPSMPGTGGCDVNVSFRETRSRPWLGGTAPAPGSLPSLLPGSCPCAPASHQRLLGPSPRGRPPPHESRVPGPQALCPAAPSHSHAQKALPPMPSAAVASADSLPPVPALCPSLRAPAGPASALVGPSGSAPARMLGWWCVTPVRKLHGAPGRPDGRRAGHLQPRTPRPRPVFLGGRPGSGCIRNRGHLSPCHLATLGRFAKNQFPENHFADGQLCDRPLRATESLEGGASV